MYSVPYICQSKTIYDSKNTTRTTGFLLVDSRESENIRIQIQSWLTLSSSSFGRLAVFKLRNWEAGVVPYLRGWIAHNALVFLVFLGFSFKVICNIFFETGIDAKIKAQRWPNKFANKYSTTTTEKQLWRYFKWCKQIVVSTNHISVRQYLRCFVRPMKICASSAEYRIFEKSKHSQLFKSSQTKIDANKPSSTLSYIILYFRF